MNGCFEYTFCVHLCVVCVCINVQERGLSLFKYILVHMLDGVEAHLVSLDDLKRRFCSVNVSHLHD